jgi:hypothetical protein
LYIGIIIIMILLGFQAGVLIKLNANQLLTLTTVILFGILGLYISVSLDDILYDR